MTGDHMTDIESMLRDFEWAALNREPDERNQGLAGRAARAQQRIVDEMARVARDRDLWKERHDRERAAHAKNLTEQQKVEAQRDRLREAIYWALGERGDFPGEPPPLAGKYRRAYHWRTELRRRSGLPDSIAGEP